MSMRIISQDGCYDAPYEKAVLHIFKYKDEYEIGAFSLDTIDDGEAYLCMAIYFTKEKAIKAMEMCKEAYEGYLEVKGAYNELTFRHPKVFQFPKDEEVII